MKQYFDNSNGVEVKQSMYLLRMARLHPVLLMIKDYKHLEQNHIHMAQALDECAKKN